MKVFIGKYKSWIGPYQLADILQKVGVSEKKCYKIGGWLSNTYLMKICEWIDKKRKRKIKVEISDYDTWDLDETLSIIILPLLKQFQKNNIGTPNVDDNDVPENIRSIHDDPKENEYDFGSKSGERWEYILNEIIWSFEQIQPYNDWELLYHKNSKFDHEGYSSHQKRISNGLVLFGKYYQAFWE